MSKVRPPSRVHPTRAWPFPGAALALALALAAPAAAQDAPAEDAPTEPPASTACIEPERISREMPIYPIEAIRNRVQGIVIVRAEIAADGRVSRAEAVDGPRTLLRAATDFIRGSTFSPKTCGGVAEATTIETPVEYRLGSTQG